MSVDRWLSLIGYLAAFVALISVCATALDRVMAWAEKSHKGRLSRYTAKTVRVVFAAVFTVIALSIWAALMFNAYKSVTTPSTTTEDCRQEHDAKGPHTTCD